MEGAIGVVVGPLEQVGMAEVFQVEVAGDSEAVLVEAFQVAEADSAEGAAADHGKRFLN